MQKKNNIFFAFLLLLHVALAYTYIAQRDICSDEPSYIEYAKRWLHGQPERVEPLDDSKTPLTVIAWLPRIVEQFRHKETKYNDWGRSDQEAGRYMMVLFTLLTALYIFKWGRKLLGEQWSLLPVTMFLFDPLVLGHSGIIGSDVASAFVYTALLFHLWQWQVDKKKKDIWVMSFFLGMACITKQNMVLLLFIVPVLSFVHHFKTGTLKLFFSVRSLSIALVSLLIVLFVINAAFFFHGSFRSLAAYQFQSSTFLNLQSKLGFLSSIPLPLPEPFVKGFDMIQYHAHIGGGLPASTYDGVNVLGQNNMHQGFWFYYLFIAFFKMPLPVILLGIAGFLALLKMLFNKKLAVRIEWMVMLLPMTVFFLVISLFNPFQIGFRHVIFFLPTFYLLLTVYIKNIARRKVWLFVFAAWQVVSVAFYFNNYIAYTNELAFNKTQIINWIPDSSIDYAPNNYLAKKYVNENVYFKLPDSVPSKGKFAIRAVDVLHINKQMPDKYAWLRNYKPYGNYKGTVWLYDIQ